MSSYHSSTNSRFSGGPESMHSGGQMSYMRPYGSNPYPAAQPASGPGYSAYNPHGQQPLSDAAWENPSSPMSAGDHSYARPPSEMMDLEDEHDRTTGPADPLDRPAWAKYFPCYPMYKKSPNCFVGTVVSFVGVTFVLLVVLGATGNLTSHSGYVDGTSERQSSRPFSSSAKPVAASGVTSASALYSAPFTTSSRIPIEVSSPHGLTSRRSSSSPSSATSSTTTSGSSVTSSSSVSTTTSSTASATSSPSSGGVQPHATSCPGSSSYISNVNYIGVSGQTGGWQNRFSPAKSADDCCKQCYDGTGCDAWLYNPTSATTPCTFITFKSAAVPDDKQCPNGYVQQMTHDDTGSMTAGLGPCALEGWDS